MKKLKVMTVVGTRPEIIRLSAIINKLDAAEAISHTLVHTGQNYDYELNEVFFADFKIRKPDFLLEASAETVMETIGNIISRVDRVIESVKPDAFLVLGDTNSCLSAIAAKRRRVPVFHMEAGNRCFDQRVPEETNRKIVDHLADINLTYSDIAREYLIREGFPPDRIIKTGSPMYEVISSRLDDINRSDILTRLGLKEKEYFVVSAHREENIEDEGNYQNLTSSLNAVAEKYQVPIIVSTHPRTRNKVNERKTALNSRIVLLKPLGFNDYIKLETKAKAVLSDSGTISEESSILGFPALNIREAHERPEAMEEASVMMVGLGKDRILQGLMVLENLNRDGIEIVRDYSVRNVSDKMIRIILSYTDYVNRVVWGSQPK